MKLKYLWIPVLFLISFKCIALDQGLQINAKLDGHYTDIWLTTISGDKLANIKGAGLYIPAATKCNWCDIHNPECDLQLVDINPLTLKLTKLAYFQVPSCGCTWIIKFEKYSDDYVINQVLGPDKIPIAIYIGNKP